MTKCASRAKVLKLCCVFLHSFPFSQELEYLDKSWNSGISEILPQPNKDQVLDGMQTREKKPSCLNSHVEPRVYIYLTHTHTHTHTFPDLFIKEE